MAHVDYEVNYPTKFPLDVLSDTGRIVRNGLIVEEKACFKKNLWILDGFASLQFFGEPEDHPVIGASPVGALPAILGETDCCDKIDAMVAANSGPDDGTVKAFNPAMFLAILQMLMKLWDANKDK